jgi:hypothetical protein
MSISPNAREIEEAVVYIKDALSYLAPMEDDLAIESLIQALEFLTGDTIAYTDLRFGDSAD